MIDRIIKYLLYSFFLLVPLAPWKLKYHGIPLSVDFVLAFLIIILYVVRSLMLRRLSGCIKELKGSWVSDKLLKLILVYVFIGLLSFIKSINLSTSISEMLRFISYAALYYVVVHEVRDRKYLYSIFSCLLISCIIAVVFGIVQYFTGIGLDERFKVPILRIGSTMYNPNNYAAFIMLVSYTVLVAGIYIRSRKLKAVLFSLFTLMIVSIVLTYSRGAWLGVLFGGVILVLIYNRRIAYFLAALPLPVIFIGSLRDRFLSIFSFEANISRIKLWKTGLLMIRDNPILGVGLGNSIHVYDSYIKKYPELNAYYTSYPLHNSYLKVQAETGIFGIILFLMILFYVSYSVFKIYKSTGNRMLKGLSGGFFVSSLGYLAMNFFDNCFFDPQTAVFYWLIFSIIVAFNNMDNTKAAGVHKTLN